MDKNLEELPPKERNLERDSAHSFGICAFCGNPIKYPAIRIPIECTEVSNPEQGLSLKKYNVTYADFHASCAAYRILESGDVTKLLEAQEYPVPKTKNFIQKLAYTICKKRDLLSDKKVTGVTIQTPLITEEEIINE